MATVRKCSSCGKRSTLKSVAKRLCRTCYAREWQRAKRAQGVCYRKEEPCISCGELTKMRREFRCSKCFYAYKVATDPEWLERKRKSNREAARRKSEKDPEYREKKRQYSREYRAI